ncbi:DUF1600 domain-containing protein [Mycoplasma sp. E35C]|uniref:DUF1600 domain-containing protein n=1 Tax=Mycoplasma sp. E35C TaxID=2801918 RepID=UPI001CA3950B|nr:DUF1600 domain-containing protein [Mycoplasma sp. E35C]QZX48997.1 DUF1600 domain-containing protein [Mycoplasma sp. E35C]
MDLSNKKHFCIKNWYKNLSRAQKMFFFVFLMNVIAFGFVVYSFIDSLTINVIGKDGDGIEALKQYSFKNGFTEADKFTNQSNILLLVFSIFFVFFPKNSVLKNDKFLISTIVYIFFTFFGYNFILNFTGRGFTNPINTLPRLITSVVLHLINPLVFIVCGFLKYLFEPLKEIKKFHSYLIPGMIYPILYLVYAVTIPYVYKINGQMAGYSVYGFATDVVNNPKVAWPISLGMIFIYFPITFFLAWYGAKKISWSVIKKQEALKTI